MLSLSLLGFCVNVHDQILKPWRLEKQFAE